MAWQSVLHESVAAVAPIYGVTIGQEDDKATWLVLFRPGATDSQKEAARSVIQAFDPAAAVARRLIDKSLVLERLTDDQLSQSLSLMSARQKERWRMPGYPGVYVDDPELLAMLSAIGADPAVVLA